MKLTVRFFVLSVAAFFVLASFHSPDCFARKREKYQQELTDNKKLQEANRIYKKAVRYIERGDGALRKRPGEALQLYSNAESYLNNTIYKLNELGQAEDIDVSKEVTFCEELWRETHVKTGTARSMSR
jgi:hypothetical protein